MQERKYIGNIVTQYRPDRFPSMFNVTRGIEGAMDGIPTLIVGLETARNTIGGFSILEKSYDGGMLFWTYRKNERRYEFEDDIEAFYQACIGRILGKISYKYLNVTAYGYGNLKKTVSFFRSPVDKTCFLTRGSSFIFMYAEEYGTVFGLSLQTLEYAGVPRKKALSRIRQNPHNRFIHDTSFITQDLRKTIGDNTHYIPVLYGYFS